MKPKLHRGGDGVGTRGARWLLVATTCAAALVSASPAFASTALKEEFLPFADCPLEAASVCLVAKTTSGEFVIGHKTVPIEQTVTLQGGLASTSREAQPLLGATDGDTLSQTPLKEPGGLVGIGELGGEVTATAELAGPPSSVIVDENALLLGAGTAVTLPIKVKLNNATLGEECYVGSDAEPIVLHLTTGTTSPPAPTEPIKGGATVVEGGAKGKITRLKTVTLVDNDFAVPGASGCGGTLSPLIDVVVDADVGIPAAAGQSKAIMAGPIEETLATWAEKYLPKKKKPKKEKKEKKPKA
jgi:hypothetical protein